MTTSENFKSWNIYSEIALNLGTHIEWVPVF